MDVRKQGEVGIFTGPIKEGDTIITIQRKKLAITPQALHEMLNPC